MVVDVVTEFSREGGLSEWLSVYDLVLMIETIKSLWNKFLKWNEAFVSKGLKVNLGKVKVMGSGGNTEDGLFKIKFTHVESAA